MSFAFIVDADEYDYDTDTRKILSIEKLFDVSVVDMPFYDATSVYARGLEASDFEEKRQQLREQEEQRRILEEKKKEILAKLG